MYELGGWKCTSMILNKSKYNKFNNKPIYILIITQFIKPLYYSLK